MHQFIRYIQFIYTVKFDSKGWHKPLFELATAELNLIKKGPAISLVSISLLSDTEGIFFL